MLMDETAGANVRLPNKLLNIVAQQQCDTDFVALLAEYTHERLQPLFKLDFADIVDCVRAIRTTIDEKALLQLLSKSFLPVKVGHDILTESEPPESTTKRLKEARQLQMRTLPTPKLIDYYNGGSYRRRNGDRKGPDKIQPSATGQLFPVIK
ncbi:conserved domain protein [Trichinella spiralis]|uniref:hypothetical protein n=1 Tax=Trichinella spiralis TaxID=6334 RepID=UPI0001EFC3F2|nr:conserved domain protein [Trichinella spiralis]